MEKRCVCRDLEHETRALIKYWLDDHGYYAWDLRFSYSRPALRSFPLSSAQSSIHTIPRCFPQRQIPAQLFARASSIGIPEICTNGIISATESHISLVVQRHITTHAVWLRARAAWVSRTAMHKQSNQPLIAITKPLSYAYITSPTGSSTPEGRAKRFSDNGCPTRTKRLMQD